LVERVQVPESVVDKRSSAYNKGRVFIHGADERTANAYKKQFQTDLAGFLMARSVEMKREGSMFLVCLARTSVDPTDQGGAGLLFGTHFQDAWDDLVQEVIIIITNIFMHACVNSACPLHTPSISHFPLADQKGLKDTVEIKRPQCSSVVGITTTYHEFSLPKFQTDWSQPLISLPSFIHPSIS